MIKSPNSCEFGFTISSLQSRTSLQITCEEGVTPNATSSVGMDTEMSFSNTSHRYKNYNSFNFPSRTVERRRTDSTPQSCYRSRFNFPVRNIEKETPDNIQHPRVPHHRVSCFNEWQTPTPTQLHEGYLYKRGVHNTAWQIRWCILDGRYLRYFHAKHSTTWRGCIDMSGAKVHQEDSKSKLEFQVRICKRTYYFRANSSKDKFRWLLVLRAATRTNEKDSNLVQGLLEKRGFHNTAWKARWCVLDGQYLRYFSRKNSKSPKGRIYLSSAQIFEQQTKSDMEFQVHVPGRRYFFKSHDMQDKCKWMDALIKATNIKHSKVSMAQSEFMMRSNKYLCMSPTKVKSNNHRAFVKSETRYQDEIIRMTFMPQESIGFGLEGNRITSCSPEAVAHHVGVRAGWSILSINGIAQPNDSHSILCTIKNAKRAGIPINIRFWTGHKLAPEESISYGSRLSPGTSISYMCGSPRSSITIGSPRDSSLRHRSHRRSIDHATPLHTAQLRTTWQDLGYPVDNLGQPEFVIWNSCTEIKDVSQAISERTFSRKSGKIKDSLAKAVSYLQIQK